MNTNRLIYRLLTLILLMSLLACASKQNRDDIDSDFNPAGDKITQLALTQLGVPYRLGGMTPSGFDCSGLVHYVYAEIGKTIPRTAESQHQYAIPIAQNQLRSGDLLFFDIEGNRVSHVGIYIGQGKFIHAPKHGRTVSIARLNAYWQTRFVAAGRITLNQNKVASLNY